uniref:Ion_trans_2 domain-containing protein n=1 Tax=Meloidogyne hapla TaxID=6305 RepID=A0A1I8BM49_MELHA
MLNEMNGNKNENLNKNEENKENDFLKVYEEISSELNEIIKSFKNNFGKEKAKVDWFNVKSCFGSKMESSSMANPMQLIRKKRYYSGGYKSFADYNMVDKVVFFIVYIIGGGFILVLGSNVALLRILAFFGDDGDIHCPVP